MDKVPKTGSLLSPAKRALLEQLRRKAGIAPSRAECIPRRKRNSPCPLSFAQQRLWFLDQLAPNNPFYNLSAAMYLEGRLDLEALERSVNEIVRRHEALRTRIEVEEGEPVQVIEEWEQRRLEVEDLTELAREAREEETRRRMNEEARTGFDLRRGPLLRVKLLKLGEEEHVGLFTMHHIISDGWSVDILRREMGALYTVYSGGDSSPLADLPIQYADFAAWQREYLSGAKMEREVEYWTKQLRDAAITELPADYVRPASLSYRGASECVALGREASEGLKRLNQQEGTTLFMALMAAFKALLMRYSGKEDVVVGTPIANRTRREVEGLIGFFVNTLVLRTDLSGNPSFRELIGREREVALGAYAHQEAPFEKLVEEIKPGRDLSRSPLFQVMMALQNTRSDELQVRGLKLKWIDEDTSVAKFDLTLVLTEGREEITGSLGYSEDLYNRETIRRLARHYERVVKEIVRDADQRIREIDLMNDAEREQILVEWNKTAIEYPRDRSIQEMFEEQVERAPDRVAVVYEGRSVSYQELNRRANQLAHHLRRLGVGAEARVGICVGRSVEMIVGILGILKAGGAYLPLDPAYPAERLRYMLNDGEPLVLLTEERWLGELPEFEIELVRLDRDWPLIEKQSVENPAPQGCGDNLAYVIYTSGSTGRPKGVSVTQRNVARLVKNNPYATLDERQALLQNAPLSFDASTFELWGALLNGGRLAVMAGEGADLWKLGDVISRQQITTLWLTASLFNAVVDIKGGVEWLRGVDQLLIGGEALSPNHLRRAAERLPATELINGYGPTEVTTFSCCHRIKMENLTSGRSVPIGRPIANTELYILDEWLKQAPLGARGELYIGGDGVARSYLGRPDLTAERFIPNLFSRGGGERLYRTGDVVRYLSNGEVEYIGRTDNQVKVRGYRIELREIEAALEEHGSVKQCAVVMKEDEKGNKRLLGYVVCEGEAPSALLKKYLRERLPEYMAPDEIVALEELPVTVNGKIDRKRLAMLEGSVRTVEKEYCAPRTPVEEILVGIFEEVLKLDRVGIRDNFFELGGHSLLATQAVSRVRNTFEVEIGVKSLFEAPTAESLARRIEEAMRSGDKYETPPLVRAGREGHEGGQIAVRLPLSFAQQRLWFIEQLEPGNTVYNIPGALRLEGRLDLNALERAINEIVRRHEVLRTRIEVEEGEPVQMIDEWEPRRLEITDLKGLTREERERETKRIAREEAGRGFDLRRGVLLRVKALELEEEKRLVLFTMHHIVSDGWSMGILSRELGALYKAFSAGEASPLDELPIQYADFAVWQREWLRGEALEEKMNYWRKQLELAPELELPTINRPQKSEAPKAASYTQVMPADIANAVKRFSEQKDFTLFMMLLTAFAMALHRSTGQRDLVIGTDIANRNRTETEPLIGFFVNEILLRINIEGDPTFDDLLTQVRETALNAYLYQDVPFNTLVETLKPERRNMRTPLIRAKLVVQNAPSEPLSLPSLTIGVEEMSEMEVRGGVKCDFLLTYYEREKDIVAKVAYDESIILKSTTIALLCDIERLLVIAVGDPTLKLSALTSKLSDLKKHQRMQKITNSFKLSRV